MPSLDIRARKCRQIVLLCSLYIGGFAHAIIPTDFFKGYTQMLQRN